MRNTLNLLLACDLSVTFCDAVCLDTTFCISTFCLTPKHAGKPLKKSGGTLRCSAGQCETADMLVNYEPI